MSNKNVSEEQQIKEGVVVDFPWGLPGLEYEQYLLISFNAESPFYFLQSVEEPQVGILLINPFVIDKNYEFELEQETAKMLKLSQENQVTVFCTVNTNKGLESATVNRLAPIVINTKEHIAKQIVLTDQRYSIREPLKLLSLTGKEVR